MAASRATFFESKPWCVGIDLLAGDATKLLKAAPGAGKKLVVTRWSYYSVTSAAQAITLGDGTIIVGRLVASITAGVYVPGMITDLGIQLTANTAFSITPAAAGPAGFVHAEGYIIG
jgi:hypothetical protein